MYQWMLFSWHGQSEAVFRDLGYDMSSVRNFCCCSSDVISQISLNNIIMKFLIFYMVHLQSSMVVGKLWRSLFIFLHNILFCEQKLSWAFPVSALALLVVLSSNCGSNSSHADINSIGSGIQPHSQGSLLQSNLALYMGTHLIWTPRYYKQFANCLRGKKALTSFLNSTHIIRTPRQYEHFL